MAEADSVYVDGPDDDFPGARKRSRPGTGPNEEVYEFVTDPNTGRQVSHKPANSAFLASKAKREAFEARRDQASQRRKNPPPSPSSSSSTSFLPKLFLALLFIPLLSNFLTSSYTFNLSPIILPKIRRFRDHSPYSPFRKEVIYFTPLQLSMYDGTDSTKPVYLAIDGEVFDVSANRRIYGKGGSYNMMAGKDASRSFVTGCFKTHQTHDLRGLSAQDLTALDNWKSFFNNHESYTRIGKVLNPPIDPSSLIPASCDDTASNQDRRLGQNGRAQNQAQSEGQGQSHLHAPGEKAAERGTPIPGPVERTEAPHAEREL